MHRNEQIGVVLAGDLGPLAQRNEVVTGAHQHGFEPRLGIQQRFQLPGNGQNHFLFTHAPRADRPGILATMPGVDGNLDVPASLLHRLLAA